MGSRGASSGKPKAMTEQEYLNSKGVGDSMSGWVIDKLRGNRQLSTQSGRKRFLKERDNAEKEYQAKREKAKEEYKNLLKKGKVRDKTSLEKSIEKAHGHPDNQSTQSARRMLAKRGYDWRTGKKLK